MDEMTGQHDTIGQVAAQVKLAGKVKGTCRRCMTTALTLRAVLLMTLMPEADYMALMTALLGDLAGVPGAGPPPPPPPAAAGDDPGRGRVRDPRRLPGPCWAWTWTWARWTGR